MNGCENLDDMTFMKATLKKILSATALLLCAVGMSYAKVDYDRYFEETALRVDFALVGNSSGQSAALSSLRQEPVWAGPRVNLIDSFGYGHYYVNVYDAASGTLIYSRGFSTLFFEWMSMPQAEVQTQAWPNSVTVPFPKETVRFEIVARDNYNMDFEPIFEIEIDPRSIDIDRSRLVSGHVRTLASNGDYAAKVDLVFVAEGYTEEEFDKFFSDAQRFSDALFATDPFSKHREDFNVRAVAVISEDSGTSFSGRGEFRNTALSSGFYTFSIERYLTIKDIPAVRDAVWDVPTDVIFILVNDPTYGGAGIYNFYACGTSDNVKTIEVFTHELGHSFAGLADEYFYEWDETMADFYDKRTEPWEPNITTMVDFASKWKDMADNGTAGVYEGGGYSVKGIWRPSEHCMMRDLVDFCPVCCRAIERMIDYYCDRQY